MEITVRSHEILNNVNKGVCLLCVVKALLPLDLTLLVLTGSLFKLRQRWFIDIVVNSGGVAVVADEEQVANVGMNGILPQCQTEPRRQKNVKALQTTADAWLVMLLPWRLAEEPADVLPTSASQNCVDRKCHLEEKR